MLAIFKKRGSYKNLDDRNKVTFKRPPSGRSLEIPCKMIFESEKKKVLLKVKKFITLRIAPCRSEREASPTSYIRL